MFKKPTQNKTIPEKENDIIDFWKKNKIFQKTVDENKEQFVFVDGPPFVSGSPHYGSLVSSIYKDVIPRYKTMKGKSVRRVWGWDCHGLPIEEKINNELKIRNRKHLEEEIGIDKYIEHCKTFVQNCITDWQWYIDKIGRWVDTENAYKTMDLKFNQSVIWSFKQMYDKGYIYKGKRVSLYSTDTQTPVSNFEVSMDPDNYKDTVDLSVYAKFTLNEELFSQYADVSLIAWTTTPWTLPSNFAIAVNPDLIYCLVEIKEDKKEYIIVAKEKMSVLKDTKNKIVKQFKGSKIKGLSYKPLFNFFINESNENDYKIYNSAEVMATEGTGILHIAPAYGELDNKLGKEWELSDFANIDEEGKLIVGEYKGIFIKKANAIICEDLKKENKVFKTEMYTHRLPYYRGRNPLIYFTQDAYFINLKKVNKRILELNEDVNWIPENFKDKRFKYTVENAPDWCISRNRYWATIMPIWKNEEGDSIVCGSVKDMTKYTNQITNKDGEYFFEDKPFTLHRDICDKIVLEKDGKKYYRVPEVLDVWLDSGCVPFAEYSYPFVDKKKFENSFPADFIVEYTGQIRAWFQMLFRVSVMTFDKAPFKNVLVHGVIAGTDGRKMSKSYKNYPDPKLVLNTIGADALRLYFCSHPLAKGENMVFNETDLRNKVKGVLNIFHNSAMYFFTYADSKNVSKLRSTNILDTWLNIKLNLASKGVDENLEKYDLPKAVEYIEDIINELSTWYIRRSRDRISSNNEEATSTLYFALKKVCIIAAPIVPFITEDIYQNLKTGKVEELKESVHLEQFLNYEELTEKEDNVLKNMKIVQNVCSLGNSIRKKHDLPVRQPLSKIVTNAKLDANYYEIIKDELNIKKVVYKKENEEKSFLQEHQDNLYVALDKTINESLRIEGEFRKLVRQINSIRKSNNLQVTDFINLELEDTKDNKKVLHNFEKELKNKVQAENIKIGESTRIV